MLPSLFSCNYFAPTSILTLLTPLRNYSFSVLTSIQRKLEVTGAVLCNSTLSLGCNCLLQFVACLYPSGEERFLNLMWPNLSKFSIQFVLTAFNKPYPETIGCFPLFSFISSDFAFSFKVFNLQGISFVN